MSIFIPAVNWRIYIIKSSGTLYISTFINKPFFHSSYGRKKLQSRTWSRRLLCGLVKERAGLIQSQFCIVFCIHIIGKPVIVISRIRYTCHNIPVLNIYNDCGSRTWHKGKLCRLNFKIIDFVNHKIICSHCTGSQILVSAVIFIQNTLFI